MSDFIYSSEPLGEDGCSDFIREIYAADPPSVRTFGGPWGSLAVSETLYNGFQPLETETHIFVVIGGPVLCFRDNEFLTGADPQTGTRAIYERWRRGELRWDEDLSGPFVALIVDKPAGRCICVTDLMAFIPVYRFERDGAVFLGTHVDALARAAGLEGKFDLASLADFVIYGHVTFPCTAYDNVRQCRPATVYDFERAGDGKVAEAAPHSYWLPTEDCPYNGIGEAALALRNGLRDYVSEVTASMNEAAHFLSAGEDSRVVAGLLPARLRRDAYIFLDGMNREGDIAGRAAKAYGCQYNVVIRNPTYYLDILPEAATLIGSGHEYQHAHGIGFYRKYGLDRYPAVFGGYAADMLLKGTMRRKIGAYAKIRFLPEFFLPAETRTRPTADRRFKQEILAAVDGRRRRHIELLRTFRPVTCHEWFHLWPLSMRVTFPNLYSNRRLFRTYEPFMAKQVIKVSAAVPTHWKLNRRLFNRAVRPFLRPSKWLFHADGRLPYFPWWINLPVQASIIVARECGKLVGLKRGYQGPWGDWRKMMTSEEYSRLKQLCQANFHLIVESYAEDDVEKILDAKSASRGQRINLLNVLYLCGKYAAATSPRASLRGRRAG